MISAWGVDDGGVSKSFIPGKGFVKITEHAAKKGGKKALHAATRQGRYLRPPMSEADAMKVQAVSDTRESVRQLKELATMTSDDGRMHASLHLPDNVGGIYIPRGDKRAGGDIFLNDHNGGGMADMNQTIKHELAHARPKRSTWRMAQITADPKKVMREEARADMEAGKYYRATKPTENGYIQRARTQPRKEATPEYRKTQDKIQRARNGGKTGPYKHGSEDWALRRQMGERRVEEFFEDDRKVNAALWGTGAVSTAGLLVHENKSKKKKLQQAKARKAKRAKRVSFIPVSSMKGSGGSGDMHWQRDNIGRFA